MIDTTILVKYQPQSDADLPPTELGPWQKTADATYPYCTTVSLVEFYLYGKKTNLVGSVINYEYTRLISLQEYKNNQQVYFEESLAAKQKDLVYIGLDGEFGFRSDWPSRPFYILAGPEVKPEWFWTFVNLYAIWTGTEEELDEFFLGKSLITEMLKESEKEKARLGELNWAHYLQTQGIEVD